MGIFSWLMDAIGPRDLGCTTNPVKKFKYKQEMFDRVLQSKNGEARIAFAIESAFKGGGNYFDIKHDLQELLKNHPADIRERVLKNYEKEKTI